MGFSFAAPHVAPEYFRFIPPLSHASAQFVVDQILRLSLKTIRLDTHGIRGVRQRIAAVDARLGRIARDVTRTEQLCDDVQAHWIEVPASRRDRVLLYFNGGGFSLRMPKLQTAMVTRWCRLLQARALMPDYRLAPEHPFPAAPDDCLASYRWLLGHGVPAKHIVICGDSAGGNLTLVTLMRAREAGLPMPAAAVMLSPALDFSMSGRSAVVNEAHDPMFSLALLRWLGEMYLTEPDLHLSPALSPITGDFRDLPPLLFQVGSNEMLLDDSTRAAAKAHASGVPVQIDVFDGMPHVFQYIAQLAETKRADKNVAAFLAKQAGWKRIVSRASGDRGAGG